MGGLVAPWIAVESDDGRHVFGAVHARRAQRCVVERRCQIDGQPLARIAVAFVRQPDLDLRWTAEPAMHPECANYSAAACPMVAGRMDRHRSSTPPVAGMGCPDPECDCAGWIADAGSQHRSGHTAEAYYALWLSGYEPAVNQEGTVGLTWRPEQVRRIRTVSPKR